MTKRQRTEADTPDGLPAKGDAPAPSRTTPAPALDLGRDGVLRIEASGDFTRLVRAAGSAAVATGLVQQIAALGSHGRRTDAEASNFALGFVDGMAPRDAAEALLLTQMAAVHQSAMMLARRLNHVETIAQQDAAERALNKLARTYAAQLKALKRYRSKGQQTVRVERVTVESGAHAMVGNISHGGRGEDEC